MSAKNNLTGSRFRPVVAISIIIFALAGCTTGPGTAIANPFGILGAGSSYVLVLPVKANRPLLELMARSQKEAKDRESLLRAIDRTEVVYAGMYPPSSVSGAASPSLPSALSLRLLASGSYPKAASSLIFPESKGWKKMTKPGVGSWYRAGGTDAALPRSGLVCLSTGGAVPEMLANVRNPGDVQTTGSFASYAATAAVDGRIGLFVSDTKNLLGMIFGPDISFPVQYAEVFASPDSGPAVDGGYRIDAAIKLADARSARALMTLVRLGLTREVRHEDSFVYIADYRVSSEKLVKMASYLYLGSISK